MSKGSTEIEYNYDDNGLRTSKTVGENTIRYIYNGGRLVSQGDGADALYFLYDENGGMTGLLANEDLYLYVRNEMGDVIGLIDESKNLVVEYTYDAWGHLLSTTGSKAITIGALNPIRYRGYYYDIETGYYYLQSRYYDSEIGRFLNADVQFDEGAGILATNLYLYCANSPITCIDPTGYGLTYVLYYNNPGSGFKDQVMNSPYYNKKSKDVKLIGITKRAGFTNAWNSIRGKVDYIYLYLHGGTGVLYFKGETMSMSQIKKLKSKKVQYRVYLFSCHGGDGKEGNNVAWAFAKLTSTRVIACTGSVSFSKIWGKYYARKAWDWGIIKTFYYEKEYIWWGKVVAKSIWGQW